MLDCTKLLEVAVMIEECVVALCKLKVFVTPTSLVRQLEKTICYFYCTDVQLETVVMIPEEGQ